MKGCPSPLLHPCPFSINKCNIYLFVYRKLAVPLETSVVDTHTVLPILLQRPVMDEIESDEALRFYQFLNYLDGGSFGTGRYYYFI